MSGVFSGRMHNLWVDFRVRPDKLRLSYYKLASSREILRFGREYRKLLNNYFLYKSKLSGHATITKFIRANLMLGWLRRKYDARIVLLLRHPAAVAESKMRLGERDWDSNALLRPYRQCQSSLARELPNLGEILTHSLTVAAAHAVAWCIENVIPLRHADDHGYCVVFYEELVENADSEWKRIVDFLGLERTSGGFTCRVDSWMGRLGYADRSQIGDVLNLFGVEVYGVENPMPNT
jgi:hypothetical protein